ncbi:hypothetical protein, partial [Meridianimarinicoccus sp. MJW13]|uniref:hypothetical protein n=1 Tax=Meridianimarinicoccus sp. MJW13 TaxID=2720031 RepID=UPI001D004E74
SEASQPRPAPQQRVAAPSVKGCLEPLKQSRNPFFEENEGFWKSPEKTNNNIRILSITRTATLPAKTRTHPNQNHKRYRDTQ